MTKDEALKLALDALEDIGDEWGFTSQRTVPKRKEALTAIKESLVQPEQDVGIIRYADISVGKIIHNSPPPQRKPLTDEEIWEALGGIDCTRPMLIARAIEAKLKEKNT